MFERVAFCAAGLGLFANAPCANLWGWGEGAQKQATRRENDMFGWAILRCLPRAPLRSAKKRRLQQKLFYKRVVLPRFNKFHGNTEGLCLCGYVSKQGNLKKGIHP